MKKLLVLALLAAAFGVPAPARLGETMSELKTRYGKPAPQVRKDTLIWLFEAEDETGQLLFTATFNDRGVSIAEGLKPLKRAKFTRDNAESFIDTQLEPYRKSPTLRTIKPGTKYRFAGKEYTCGDHELVIVDDPHGILVVWTQAGLPNVIAVTPVMMQ